MMGATREILELTHLDVDGNVIDRWRAPPNSQTNKWAAIMAVQASQNDTDPTITDVFGTEYTINNDNDNFSTIGNSGVNNRGVNFGSSDVAFSHQQDSLQSPFTSGVTYNSGSVSYIGGSVDSRVEHSRTMTNESGADITVQEAALYALSYTNSGSSRTFMLARNVLGSPTTLSDGEGIQGTYTFLYD
jgi:hypothetical protein